ncbi:MAG TPA: hypothetical protein VJ227_02795 [Patescibacteria group bacterium]|nr:hypothetical protein [Patescibacteria group bacterium]
MKELALYPDFGGTSCDFTREVLPNKLTFCLREGTRTTRVEFPGGEAFMAISMEEAEGGRFLEAFYEYPGEMLSARIWYGRYCNQQDFEELAHPDENTRSVKRLLAQNNMDLILDARPDTPNVIFSLWTLKENGSLLKMVSIGGSPLPLGQISNLEYSLANIKGGTSAVMCVGLIDGTLTLGVTPNRTLQASDHLSTFVNIKNITGFATPGEIKRILKEVFLKEI